jgi:hypothetical protein
MAKPAFKLSIDVTKVDKQLLKHITRQNGEKGIMLNLVCWFNEDGKDKYDQDGRVKHDINKEQAEQGLESKAILGNFKIGDLTPFVSQDDYSAQTPPPKPVEPHITDDDIPF